MEEIDTVKEDKLKRISEELDSVKKQIKILHERENFLHDKHYYTRVGPQEYFNNQVMEELFEHFYKERGRRLRFFESFFDDMEMGDYSVHKMFLRGPNFLEYLAEKERECDENNRISGRGRYQKK